MTEGRYEIMYMQKMIERTFKGERHCRKFTTTLDEKIIKDLKRGAVEYEVNTSTIIELMYIFFQNMDEKVTIEMLEEAEKKGCTLGTLVTELWRQKKEFSEEKNVKQHRKAKKKTK